MKLLNWICEFRSLVYHQWASVVREKFLPQLLSRSIKFGKSTEKQSKLFPIDAIYISFNRASPLWNNEVFRGSPTKHHPWFIASKVIFILRSLHRVSSKNRFSRDRSKLFRRPENAPSILTGAEPERSLVVLFISPSQYHTRKKIENRKTTFWRTQNRFVDFSLRFCFVWEFLVQCMFSDDVIR